MLFITKNKRPQRIHTIVFFNNPAWYHGKIIPAKMFPAPSTSSFQDNRRRGKGESPSDWFREMDVLMPSRCFKSQLALTEFFKSLVTIKPGESNNSLITNCCQTLLQHEHESRILPCIRDMTVNRSTNLKVLTRPSNFNCCSTTPHISILLYSCCMFIINSLLLVILEYIMYWYLIF